MIAKDPLMSHSRSARLLAVLFLLPLVALTTATGSFGLRCRMTGELLSGCCCAGDDDAIRAEPIATLSQADCCERELRQVTPVPAEPSVATGAVPEPAPLGAFAVAVSATDAGPTTRASRFETRTSIGPPTVRSRLVAKSSFLI
jgi:hypothetical protein